MYTILTIDDEENIRNGLADNFELEGYNVVTASNGKDGLDLVFKGGVDLVITDLRMDGIPGDEVVRQVTTKTPGIPIIVLTGHGSIDDATAAIKAGAFDFLTKPLDLNHLNLIVKNALKGKVLAEQNKLLKEQINQIAVDGMIGKSSEMSKVKLMIQKAAPTKSTVLITGESGVGKELVARAIHNNSPRKDMPMVAVNCSALSKSLLESELFGYEKGAFTDANAMHKGKFEQANGGTIFLDEIGEIDLSTQVKLLRVLQERKIERIGGEQSIDIDIRIVAATNKNLEVEVKEGRFREDLFYRLNVIRIQVPSLRERKDDIPLLVRNFLNKYNKENGTKIKGFDNRSRSAILKYSWPGNIRELENCIESACVLCSTEEITFDDLPDSLKNSGAEKYIQIPIGMPMEEVEKIVIQENLVNNNGNKTKTADVLGIGRKTLHRKIEEWESTENANSNDEQNNI